MIQFEPTVGLLRAMSFDMARRRLFRFSALAVIYCMFLSFLIFWSMVNVDGQVTLFDWLLLAATTALLALIMTGLFLVFGCSMLFRRVKEAYLTPKYEHVTYRIGDTGMTAIMGEAKSNIPYALIKDSWQTKRFIYFWVKGGAAFGLPKSAIGPADMKKLTKAVKALANDDTPTVVE